MAAQTSGVVAGRNGACVLRSDCRGRGDKIYFKQTARDFISLVQHEQPQVRRSRSVFVQEARREL